MKSIMEEIKNYKTISLIGMEKNVGKTTTLNFILRNMDRNKIIGITSIGRDGESEDLVTATKKPKIYVNKNTIIATAKDCIFKSDITKEILRTTNINTPMGKIVIVRALSDGFVEIAGPSINAQLKEVFQILIDFDCDHIFLDGALSRKTSASPYITDASVLATGASLSKDILDVVNKTSLVVCNLSIDSIEDNNIKNIVFDSFKENCAVSINEMGVKYIDKKTNLMAMDEIVTEIENGAKYMAIRGIITDRVLESIMKKTNKIKECIILIEDGTKLFLTQMTKNKFKKSGGRIMSLNKINLIGVTINPYSPYGYNFKSEEFLKKLKTKLSLPIYDVLGCDKNA